MGFHCHIAVGGDGSLEIARKFAEKGMPVIGVPKTIDGDIQVKDVDDNVYVQFRSVFYTAARALPMK